ncbi:hypothetical protein ANANG_G00087720 [Anguilla anguilla]|uniref:Uncharacterized protein n=1 Tax=Anguilla anguilla TaxID=7936 RepID=A0A9D3MN65_ANGAN|nr:hypothetical protein ANANG_G00087720 [Anguilla anguilla]
MFILNFEVMNDDRVRDPNRNLNHKLPLPWLTSGTPHSTAHPPNQTSASGFKLRLPLLRSLSNSKQSLQEDPEVGRVREPSHPSHESLALDELLSLPEPARPAPQWPEDQRTLLPDSEPRLALPLTQSSPRPHRLNPEASVSNCSLTHSRSRESFHSMRRASSVDDIEAMRPDWDRKFRTRPASTGAVNHKSNILNSTSDSDLMRYRTISKIPQITLNFVDFKPDPLIALPAGEMDIIAPCKLIDRTHNVTEKVTQVATACVFHEPRARPAVTAIAIIPAALSLPAKTGASPPKRRRRRDRPRLLLSEQVSLCRAGGRLSRRRLGY